MSDSLERLREGYERAVRDQGYEYVGSWALQHGRALLDIAEAAQELWKLSHEPGQPTAIDVRDVLGPVLAALDSGETQE